MVHAVVVGQLEKVLDLRDQLVFTVARVGNLGSAFRGSLVIEPVDRSADGGGRLDMTHSEPAGIRAVLLLEPRRADPGQSRKLRNPVDGVEVELRGVDAQRRFGYRGVRDRMPQLAE